MILEVVLYGDPVLRAKGATISTIDQGIRDLAKAMLETMYDAHGVGLAAQQVGVALQICVVDITGIEDRPSTLEIDGESVEPERLMPLVLINPEIVSGPEKVLGSEGCLSFPEMTGDIIRAERVTVTAQDIEGRPLRFVAGGLLARAIQHEVDHLNGILFIDRMSSAARAGLSGKLKRLQRENAKR